MSPENDTPQPLTPDRTQKSPCDVPRTCHCPTCHATFTRYSTFDIHRAGSHSQGTRHCVEPATVGLVDAGRAYPCWAQPGSYNPREDNQ
jgi:hypothetical protein